MCCGDIYESILGFSIHAAIKHYWILQRLQCLAGILFCQCICPHFQPKDFAPQRKTPVQMCHSRVLPQLTLTVFWVTWTFLWTGLGPFSGHTFKTIHAMNYPNCRETLLHVRKFDHLWYIASDQYNSEINEIIP